MQELRNRTAYPIAVVPFLKKDGRGVVAAIVKGTFDLPAGGATPVLADEQLPIAYADEYFEEEEAPASIRSAGDAVPLKPGTDVALVGHAYSPGGKTKTLDVQLQAGPLQQTIRVFGARAWYRALGSWKISAPLPFDRMPLRYEFAFGGTDTRDADPAKHGRDPRNPVGMGFSFDGGKGDVDGLRLPNLEHPAAPIKSRSDRPPVCGFGFINCQWEPRVRYAGTYDEEWERTRNPLLPEDFDDRFYNAAHSGLVATPHLSGGDPFRLINGSKEGDLRFNLPNKRISVTVVMKDRSQTHPSVLDTVVVEPDEQRLTLTWRATFDCGHDLTTIDSVEVQEEAVS